MTNADLVRLRRLLLLAALTGLFATTPALADRDVWKGDDPARGGASDPDDHRRTPLRLEDQKAKTGDLDASREARPGRVQDRGVRPRDPDERKARSRDPDELETRSRSLGDLPASPPDRSRLESALGRRLPNPGDWKPAADDETEAAREAFLAARGRAERAVEAYEDMRQENYPRGERRLAIERERDEALLRLGEAAARLEATQKRNERGS